MTALTAMSPHDSHDITYNHVTLQRSAQSSKSPQAQRGTQPQQATLQAQAAATQQASLQRQQASLHQYHQQQAALTA